jgi:hypothetical protein
MTGTPKREIELQGSCVMIGSETETTTDKLHNFMCVLYTRLYTEYSVQVGSVSGPHTHTPPATKIRV